MRRWNTIVTSSLLLAALASACADEGAPVSDPATEQTSAAVNALAGSGAPELGRCGQIDEFPIPAVSQGTIFPGAMVSGADGELWFTTGLAFLARMSPADQKVSLVPIPTAVQNIAAGPDGNIWFTTGGGLSVDHLTHLPGGVREIALPDLGFAGALTAGREGDIWVLGFNDIARVTVGGRVTLYPIVDSVGGSSGDPIVVGGDGNVWYARPVLTTRFIHRLNRDGTVSDFQVPATGTITDLATGPDGAIWFTTQGPGPGDNSIGRITLRGVASTVVQLPDNDATGYQTPTNMPLELTEGPDRNMYFTTYFVVPLNYIGQVTVGGHLTRFDIPTAGAASFGITTGSDGNVWFTENFNQKVGRLDLASCRHRRR
jgi:virginiamycin B lyase